MNKIIKILLTSFSILGVFSLASCNVLNNILPQENVPPKVEENNNEDNATKPNVENKKTITIVGADSLTYKTTDDLNETTILNNYSSVDKEGKTMAPLKREIESYNLLKRLLKTEGTYEITLKFHFLNDQIVTKKVSLNIVSGFKGIKRDFSNWILLKKDVVTKTSVLFRKTTHTEKRINVVFANEDGPEKKIFTVYLEDGLYERVNNSEKRVAFNIKTYMRAIEKGDGKYCFEFKYETTPYRETTIESINKKEYYYIEVPKNYFKDYYFYDISGHDYTYYIKPYGEYDFYFKNFKNEPINLEEGLPDGSYYKYTGYSKYEDNDEKKVSFWKSESGKRIVLPLPKIQCPSDYPRPFKFIFEGEKYYFESEQLVKGHRGLHIKDNKIYESAFFFTEKFTNENNLVHLGDLDRSEIIGNAHGGSLGDGILGLEFIELENSKLGSQEDFAYCWDYNIIYDFNKIKGL